MEIASSGAAVGVKDSCHQWVRYADEAHSSDRVAAVNRTDFRIDGPPSKMKVKCFIHQHAPPPPSHVPRPEKHRPITRARVGSRDRPPVLHCCYLANWGQVAAVAINATWCTLVATDRTSRKTAPLLRQHLFNDLMQNYVRSRTFASLCSLRARYQSRPQ